MANIFVDLGKYLTDNRIEGISLEYDIPYSSLKAVLEVETNGRGFYEGTLIPTVRFENHIFGKETKYKFNSSHPHLSSTSFNGKFNLVGWKEFERFQKAYTLNSIAAIKATSWGLAQIMGFNYELAGFQTLELFLHSMFQSEETQFRAMVEFINNSKLSQYLRNEDWVSFAKGYNGKNYSQNQYDVKLKNAAARYKK